MTKFLKKQTLLINPASYKVLIFFSMFYMSIMLCNAILTNRYIGNDSLFVLGGTFTSPLIFILDDIIAEIYGYKVIRFIIVCGFLAQTFFVFICQMVLYAPYPTMFVEQNSYSYVLGLSLLRIDISGFIAYIIANLSNSYFLTRWKLMLKGRFFWLRSLVASSLAAAIYSFIAIIMMELSAIPIGDILKVAAISFSIKIVCTLIFAAPATILVKYLKKITNLDVYDFPDPLNALQTPEPKQVLRP